MNPHEEPDLNSNSISRENSGQNNLFFPKHYLLLEVERLEVSIRHFFETGTISKEDYEYLSLTLKMMRKFLTTCVRCPKKKENLFRKNSWEFREKYHQKHKYSHYKTNQPSLFDIPKPFPIEISGLTEGLKALRPESLENTGPKFPYKIPAGTHWNNIVMKFLDDEKVEIWVKKQKHITDYKEMGMVGKGKIPEPSEQWYFLKVLAKCNSEITIKDNEVKDKYKKQKQSLTETLRNYFGIDYDPFYPYQSCPEKGGNSYKIKLLLIPPPDKNEEKESLENEDADNLGIHEFLSETAPQVIDPA